MMPILLNTEYECGQMTLDGAKVFIPQARREPTREGSRRTAHVGCTTRRTLLESHRLWSRPWETTLYLPRGDGQRSCAFR
jgi:hypothetical protein